MLPHEYFDTCDPISWWIGCHSQFLDLFVFAHDLLEIPGESTGVHFVNLCNTHVKAVGSAVAVERIFSGGQDMITLWQASLHPNTIWTLMLVKQHLHITRHAIDDLIGDE